MVSLYLSAETRGDVGESTVRLAFKQTLVGAGGGEGAEVGDVGADFDVVELLAVNVVWYVLATAVPGGFEGGVCTVEVCGKGCHFLRDGITTHEADTGDVVGG